ncbi:MAG TPA: hypothetical protein VJM08_10145, partial [Anaerolineales bacterium]|nr:hypothetical protein [Anaerolineales bacterium]
KRKLFLAFYALLLTMCRTYSQVVPESPIDGLSCRSYNDIFASSQGVECTYVCPNGETAGPRDFDTDPSFSATKGDLDRLFCGIEPPTFTSVVTQEAASSPTPAETPTFVPSATATVAASPTSAPPLLTGQVTMCDTGANLISFRIAEPVPDLTGRTVEAEIAGQQSICTVNPVNTSLLTCTMPPGLIFPVDVVVSLDGAVVNELTLSGVGCTEITTPVATTTP